MLFEQTNASNILVANAQDMSYIVSAHIALLLLAKLSSMLLTWNWHEMAGQCMFARSQLRALIFHFAHANVWILHPPDMAMGQF